MEVLYKEVIPWINSLSENHPLVNGTSSVARIYKDYNTNIPQEAVRILKENRLDYLLRANPYDFTGLEFIQMLDCKPFREEAIKFEKDKRYCDYVYGTRAYKEYWQEQKRRCLEGYHYDGFYITGEHYHYLNFCRIMKAHPVYGEVEGFPDFTVMDWYFFIIYQFCTGGINKDKPMENMDAFKGRRMGFSFKAASIATHRYNFYIKSTTVIAAQESWRAMNTFEMAIMNLDFQNVYTEFGSPMMKRIVSEQGCHVKAGKEVKVDGKKVPKGRLSEIFTVSFKSGDDAAAGLGASLIIIEEAGMVENLKKVHRFTDPVLKSGKIRKGIMICFGTGGNVSTYTREFRDVCLNPSAYEMKSFSNTFETLENSTGLGLFIPVSFYRQGSYWNDPTTDIHYKAMDENGNCIPWVAALSVLEDRKRSQNTDLQDWQVLLSQDCLLPSEAFIESRGSFFNIRLIKDRLEELFSHTVKPYVCGYMREEKGNVIFVPDPSIKPVNKFPLTGKELPEEIRGCVMMYHDKPSEQDLQKWEGKMPPKSVVIGHDPWGIDAELASIEAYSSLGSSYVKRTKLYFSELPHANEILATYVGRTARMDDYNYQLLLLSKYFNSVVNFENDRGEVKPYFAKMKELGRLAAPPGLILQRNQLPTSMLARKFGYSVANQDFKMLALSYLKEHLEELNHDGEIQINKIQDIPLLLELANFVWDKNKNFDRIMSYLGCVLYEQENINELAEKHGIIFNNSTSVNSLSKLLQAQSKGYKVKKYYYN